MGIALALAVLAVAGVLYAAQPEPDAPTSQRSDTTLTTPPQHSSERNAP